MINVIFIITYFKVFLHHHQLTYLSPCSYHARASHIPIAFVLIVALPHLAPAMYLILFMHLSLILSFGLSTPKHTMGSAEVYTWFIASFL